MEPAIRRGSSPPHQIGKLIMDIVLATGGKCVVMVDCFATNAIADVHAVYFIRDCIHTVDIPAGGSIRVEGC